MPLKMAYASFLMNSEFSCSVCVVLNPKKKSIMHHPSGPLKKRQGCFSFLICEPSFPILTSQLHPLR